MIVGFFEGDCGDYGGIGTQLSSLSAEWPKTWFYSVDTARSQASRRSNEVMV